MIRRYEPPPGEKSALPVSEITNHQPNTRTSQPQTLLQLIAALCVRPRVTELIQRMSARTAGGLALALLSSAMMAGCASGGAWNPSDSTIALPVSPVAHYGTGIGVPEYSLGNFHGGSTFGWGSGGSSCCVLVPRDTSKPVMVKVKWTTYRSSVGEEIEHEATVPIHFAVPPGYGSGLNVHFLPGHKVEIWYSRRAPEAADYPGPAYPRKRGPRYAPLPGERPEISSIEN